MRVTLVLIFVGLTLVLANHSHNEEKLITKETIKQLKTKATFQVIDYNHHPFKDFTKYQIINKLGLLRSSKRIQIKIVYGAPTGLPAAFNSAQKWPNCIHPIRDQESCGFCWAFAASEVLSDRFCIATKETTNVILSPRFSFL